MEKCDVLILGGSAGGMSVANTVSARHPGKRILMVRNVEYTVVPCGIPYIYGYLNAVEKDRIPDKGFLDKGVQIKIADLVDIDRINKIATFKDGSQVVYDKLVIAMGSVAKTPPIAGLDLANVFTIKKDPAYLQVIFDVVDSGIKNIVIIGGGFIGVEFAEQFKMHGDFNITLVEALPHCLMTTCEEFAGLRVEAELRRMGIDVLTNTQVNALQGSGKVESVLLSDGRELPADLVILGIGSDPNTALAEKIGLDVVPGQGIKVDAYMGTSDPDILACGDCCTKVCAIDGAPCDARLASVAALEGIFAGSNLYKKTRPFKGVVGSFCTRVGDVSVASAGLTEEDCKAKGIDYYIGYTKAPDRHPGSLPGCTTDMEMKMMFEKGTDRAIGAHVAGGVQAGDMVNIMAVAIQNRLTPEQIVASQYATHPLLTGSPLVYHVLMAAENALLNQ